MNVLIFKNTTLKCPTTLEEFLFNKNIPHHTITFLQDAFIPDTKSFDALVILGGLMSPNDEADYPFLEEEIKIASFFAHSGKKVLGICLGAQLLARALGAKAYKGCKPEIGWYDIYTIKKDFNDYVLAELLKDPDTGKIEDSFKSFEWHGYTFDLPEAVEHICKSDQYNNQAFKYKNTYSIQFHFEFSTALIDELITCSTEEHPEILKGNDKYLYTYLKRANNFYEAFFAN